jgi:hypothetical protein
VDHQKFAQALDGECANVSLITRALPVPNRQYHVVNYLERFFRNA